LPVADEVGGARPRSQTSSDSTGMGAMGTGYRRIYVTLQTSGDSTDLRGDSPYFRDIAACLRPGATRIGMKRDPYLYGSARWPGARGRDNRVHALPTLKETQR
ncbi:MAG TPA: hypothetical protein VL485_16275, partial [Ktedonobacteraceae bacterium]|nr:hypothetical protein [Ktedonobacteraceae bacterium]